VLQAEEIGAGRFKIGETFISLRDDPAAMRAQKSPSASEMNVMASMRAVGMRYITVQVRDCGGETLQGDGWSGRRGAGVAGRGCADFI
jgi:hypothetical protein